MNKFTFKDLATKFNTEQKCLTYIMKNKYKGSICPVCGKKQNFIKLKI